MTMRRIVAAAAVLMLGIGCTEGVQDVPRAMGDWHYWAKTPEGARPFQLAVLYGQQGWPGEDSRAPRISLIVEWEKGDVINAGIIAEEGKFSSDCTRNGCYAYVRPEGGRWSVLRLLATDDESSELRYLGNPWTLFDILQAGGGVEVEIPLEGKGRCTYSVNASGYDKQAHISAGPLVYTTNEDLTESGASGKAEEQTSEGPAPEWVKWPSCESSKR